MTFSKEDVLNKTPQELHKIIPLQQNWSSENVMAMISSLKSIRPTIEKEDIKVGDVFLNVSLHHPAIVIKVKDEIGYCLLMTTEETTPGILTKLESRFFKFSFITSTLILVPTENISKRFIGIIENHKCKQLIKIYKEYVSKI